MPLPPRDDPSRALDLAIRSTRRLGIVLIGLTLLAILPIAMTIQRKASIVITAYSVTGVIFYIGVMHSAIRSTRPVGMVLIGVSCLIMAPLILMSESGWFVASNPAIKPNPYLASVLPSGILYLICSVYLNRRRRWAIMLAMTLTVLQLTLVFMGFLAIVPSIIQYTVERDWPLAVFLMVLAAIFLACMPALVRLIFQLGESFDAIPRSHFYDRRGFEPIMTPPKSDGGSNAPPAQG